MRVLAVALAILTLAPSAAAWTFHGETEPSTQDDREAGFMWPGGPAETTNHVYFNVVEETSSTGQNPNDASLGAGARLAQPDPSFTAYLGVWRDCNHDGYLGAALGAMIEYRMEVTAAQGFPVDPAICPVGSGFNPDNTMITELAWIGPQDWSPNPSDITYVIPNMVNDAAARVWGDDGLPGDAPTPTCQAWPLPRGTTASTGAALAYADCFDGLQVGAPDEHLPVSLFGDPSAPGGPRVGLLQRDSGRPMASAWDCSRPRATAVRDPSGHRAVDVVDPEPASDGYLLAGSKGVEGVAEVTVFGDDPHGGPPVFHRDLTDQDGDYAALPAPAPARAPDAGGSLYDAAEQAELGAAEQCDPHKDVVPMLGLGPGPLLGKVPQPEADVAGIDPAAGRRQNSFAFDFQQMTASNQEGGTVTNGDLGAPAVGDELGHGLSLQDAGLAPLRDVNGAGPGWHATSQSLLGPRTLTREEAQPQGARYRTFYARVGVLGLSLPSDGAGYGAEACRDGIGRGAPVEGGWDCDPGDWWSPLAGASARPVNRFSGEPLGAVVGDAYQLRDVDCEDGSVAGVGASCA